eukprot:355986-Chlamydomonas_euryale.AAC.2
MERLVASFCGPVGACLRCCGCFLAAWPCVHVLKYHATAPPCNCTSATAWLQPKATNHIRRGLCCRAAHQHQLYSPCNHCSPMHDDTPHVTRKKCVLVDRLQDDVGMGMY